MFQEIKVSFWIFLIKYSYLYIYMGCVCVCVCVCVCNIIINPQNVYILDIYYSIIDYKNS